MQPHLPYQPRLLPDQPGLQPHISRVQPHLPSVRPSLLSRAYDTLCPVPHPGSAPRTRHGARQAARVPPRAGTPPAARRSTGAPPPATRLRARPTAPPRRPTAPPRLRTARPARRIARPARRIAPPPPRTARHHLRAPPPTCMVLISSFCLRSRRSRVTFGCSSRQRLPASAAHHRRHHHTTVERSSRCRYSPTSPATSPTSPAYSPTSPACASAPLHTLPANAGLVRSGAPKSPTWLRAVTRRIRTQTRAGVLAAVSSLVYGQQASTHPQSRWLLRRVTQRRNCTVAVPVCHSVLEQWSRSPRGQTATPGSLVVTDHRGVLVEGTPDVMSRLQVLPDVPCVLLPDVTRRGRLQPDLADLSLLLPYIALVRPHPHRLPHMLAARPPASIPTHPVRLRIPSWPPPAITARSAAVSPPPDQPPPSRPPLSASCFHPLPASFWRSTTCSNLSRALGSHPCSHKGDTPCTTEPPPDVCTCGRAGTARLPRRPAPRSTPPSRPTAPHHPRAPPLSRIAPPCVLPRPHAEPWCTRACTGMLALAGPVPCCSWPHAGRRRGTRPVAALPAKRASIPHSSPPCAAPWPPHLHAAAGPECSCSRLCAAQL